MQKHYPFISSHQDWPDVAGIYAIYTRYNDKWLVGQTLRGCRVRWREHARLLKNGKHDNPALQNAYHVHGESAFEFVFLEAASRRNINKRECHWISKFHSASRKCGWNLREGGAKGLYGPELRKRVSEGIRRSPSAMQSRLARAKSYKLISPIGKVAYITNARKFCRELGSSTSGFYLMLCGRKRHYKGYRKFDPKLIGTICVPRKSRKDQSVAPKRRGSSRLQRSRQEQEFLRHYCMVATSQTELE